MSKGFKSYILFYNQSALFIGEENSRSKDVTWVDVKNRVEMHSIIEKWVEQDNPQDLTIGGYDMKRLFKDFKNYFKYVQAAGGLVTNQKNQFLFIKRLGIWDLPKGKMEKNEKPKISALREVTEETGISGITITEKLPATYHIYFQNDKFVLKKTYWYRMITEDTGEPTPQAEENITAAVWLDKRESQDALRQSYRSLKDTLMPFIKY